MDYTHKLAISYYKIIAVINEPHNIFLVQHQDTQKIFVKKILDVYNINVYECLYNHHIIGTPKIIDYYEENDQLIVIEEYISGSSLQEKIQNADLSEITILDYMLDLCNILELLHSTMPAIIHRDIKPSNIIITNYNRAILLDFNAAKYHSSSSEDTVLLGTQGYAAPEQYGFGASSPQTDIYSLGILLKEMLASIKYESSFFDSIIYRCTQINPSERFTDVAELKKAFMSHIKPERKKIVPQSILKFLPPGYRTKTPWKILISSLCYLLIAWLCLSLEVKGTFGLALWIERIFVLAMMLFIVFGCFNYMDVQKIIPLCKNKHRLIRYIGIVLLNATVVFSIFIILMIIEVICFPT